MATAIRRRWRSTGGCCGQAFARHGGVEVDTQGDAFFVAFGDAAEAVAAAIEGQRALAPTGIRVRMGLHMGAPSLTEEGYVGIDVHRAARVAAAAHGRQVVITRAVRERLDDAVELRDLGEHRLKDIGEAEWLFQPVIPGLPVEFPPLKSLSTTNLPMPARRLIGRSSELASVSGMLAEDRRGHHHRRRRHRQDTAGGRGRARHARPVPQRRLLRRLGAGVGGEHGRARDRRRARRAGVTGGVAARLGGRRTSRTRRTLLVLDNFEHVSEQAAAVDRIVSGTRDVTILVTSREPLRISAERELALEPLAQGCGGRAVRRPGGSGRERGWRTMRRSRRSAAGWTGSRSPSSWPRHGRSCCRRRRCCAGWSGCCRC